MTDVCYARNDDLRRALGLPDPHHATPTGLAPDPDAERLAGRFGWSTCAAATLACLGRPRLGDAGRWYRAAVIAEAALLAEEVAG